MLNHHTSLAPLKIGNNMDYSIEELTIMTDEELQAVINEDHKHKQAIEQLRESGKEYHEDEFDAFRGAKP